MKFLPQIVFIIVVFISNIIQAITGFAGTLLAMPVSIMIIGVYNAKVVLNMMALISCFWIFVQNYKSVNWKEVFKISGFMLIGMIIGIVIFKVVSINILLYIYAVLIILIAIKSLFVKNKVNLPKYSMIVVLIVAGIIHGMFISGGSLLVVYAVSVLRDKDEFRATIAPVWVILNTIMMFEHIKTGLFTEYTLTLTLICLIPLFIATRIGNVLHKKINQQTFLKLTYILLLISGVLLII